MLRNKLFFMCGFVFLWICGQAYGIDLIKKQKIARIGDNIILISDVKKHAKLYHLDFEQAKQQLIEDEILFHVSKIYVDEPNKEALEKKIKRNKKMVAYHLGYQKSEITDDDFTVLLLNNNISMNTYKEQVKRELWITNYLEKVFAEKIKSRFKPPQTEIDVFISKNDHLFYEQESVALSMIYFSFYNSDSSFKSDDQIQMQKLNARECAEALKSGSSFIDLVDKYTDDLFSLNNNPKGYVGVINLDEPKVARKFSREIVEQLRKNSAGMIDRIFETENGLYIFKIDKKIPAKRLSVEEVQMKAEDFLKAEFINKQKLLIRKNIINHFRNKIGVIEY